jgi:pimeloyl-ACP methyl ester carboxylesterase
MTISGDEVRLHRLLLPQGPLHLTEIGSAQGPPLVFLHGVLASSRLYVAVAKTLAARRRCLLLDLPLGAHPEGMACDADLSPQGVVALIVAAFDALDVPEAILVGNDSGGALCQLLVAAHPSRVHALVLTSCDAYEVWLPLLFKPFELASFVPGALYLIGLLLRLRAFRAAPFALGWLSKRMPEELSFALVERLGAAGWARRDLSKFLRGISPRLTLRAAEAFPHFTRPVLILWSREDRFFPMRLAERLARDFPRAELAVVEDAYTFSPVDAPRAVASAIDAFAERLG